MQTLNSCLHGCPCGFLGHPRRACKCAPSAVARYRSRVSGPLLERIDLFVEVPVESKAVERLWRRKATTEETMASVGDHVLAARLFTQRTGRGFLNARLEGEALREFARPEGPAERLLADAAKRWMLSARAVHRILRVARTIADLAGADEIPEAAVAEALSYRADTHG